MPIIEIGEHLQILLPSEKVIVMESKKIYRRQMWLHLMYYLAFALLIVAAILLVGMYV